IGKVNAGAIKIWTDGAPPLEEGRVYDLADLYATLEHGGDRVAADQALVAEGWGPLRSFHTDAEGAALVAELRAEAQATAAAEAVASAWREAHEFLAEPDPEYDWLIPGLLERGDRVILTGQEGRG